jgi:hypothetical protein
MSTSPANPFLMLRADYYTPDSQLREENGTLKLIVNFQDERIAALRAENADLQRLLGLRGETVSLEQQIQERRQHE